MYLLSLIKKLYWFLFRIFVPPVCYSCSEYISEGDVLCEICQSHVFPVAPLYRKVRSYRIGIYAYAKYHGPLRKMILAKKYGKRSIFYGLAHLMKKQKILPHLQADVLIPVPLHWSRTFRRGFNQSAILAEELAQFLRADVFDGVRRVKRTRYQSSLSKVDRQENLSAAFLVKHRAQLKGKHVVIVDDLFTTGATVLSLAKEITRAKPASIQVVVACR